MFISNIDYLEINQLFYDQNFVLFHVGLIFDKRFISVALLVTPILSPFVSGSCTRTLKDRVIILSLILFTGFTQIHILSSNDMIIHTRTRTVHLPIIYECHVRRICSEARLVPK